MKDAADQGGAAAPQHRVLFSAPPPPPPGSGPTPVPEDLIDSRRAARETRDILAKVIWPTTADFKWHCEKANRSADMPPDQHIACLLQVKEFVEITDEFLMRHEGTDPSKRSLQKLQAEVAALARSSTFTPGRTFQFT